MEETSTKTKWMDQGKMTRKQAVKLGRYWTSLGHSIRIESLHWKDIVRVHLKITRRENGNEGDRLRVVQLR